MPIPAILNQTIYIDAKPYTVIGVMPEWFAFPEPDTQIWTPVYHEKPAKHHGHDRQPHVQRGGPVEAGRF